MGWDYLLQGIFLTYIWGPKANSPTDQTLEQQLTIIRADLYLKLSIGPKKDLNDLDNHDGVITHLEPDIVEFEVKWALGSITTNKLVEVMEFQLSYFKP